MPALESRLSNPCAWIDVGPNMNGARFLTGPAGFDDGPDARDERSDALVGDERPVDDRLGDERPLANTAHSGGRTSNTLRGVVSASTKSSGMTHWRLLGDTARGGGVDGRRKMVAYSASGMSYGRYLLGG